MNAMVMLMMYMVIDYEHDDDADRFSAPVFPTNWYMKPPNGGPGIVVILSFDLEIGEDGVAYDGQDDDDDQKVKDDNTDNDTKSEASKGKSHCIPSLLVVWVPLGQHPHPWSLSP